MIYQPCTRLLFIVLLLRVRRITFDIHFSLSFVQLHISSFSVHGTLGWLQALGMYSVKEGTPLLVLGSLLGSDARNLRDTRPSVSLLKTIELDEKGTPVSSGMVSLQSGVKIPTIWQSFEYHYVLFEREDKDTMKIIVETITFLWNNRKPTRSMYTSVRTGVSHFPHLSMQ